VPLIVGGFSNEDNNREKQSSIIGYERFSEFVPNYAVWAIGHFRTV